MIDDADIDVANRFLQGLLRTDPVHPMRLSSLASKLGIAMDEADRVADALYAMRRIGRCDITRTGHIDKRGHEHKAEAFTLLWLAGSVAPLTAFNGRNLRHLFVNTGSQPEALRAAHAPRVRPISQASAQPAIDQGEAVDKPRRYRTTREVRDIMARAVQGRTAEHKISRQQLADILTPGKTNAISATSNTIGAWLESPEAEWVARTKVGRKTYYYDTRAGAQPRHRSLLREAVKSILSHKEKTT